MSAKTHRDRAREAFRVTSQATSNRDTVRVEPGVWSSPAIAIARLTFPAELVKAAGMADAIMDHLRRCTTPQEAWLALTIQDNPLGAAHEAIRAALDLYPQEPKQ